MGVQKKPNTFGRASSNREEKIHDSDEGYESITSATNTIAMDRIGKMGSDENLEEVLTWINSIERRVKTTLNEQYTEAAALSKEASLAKLREKYRTIPFDENIRKLGTIIQSNQYTDTSNRKNSSESNKRIASDLELEENISAHSSKHNTTPEQAVEVLDSDDESEENMTISETMGEKYFPVDEDGSDIEILEENIHSGEQTDSLVESTNEEESTIDSIEGTVRSRENSFEEKNDKKYMKVYGKCDSPSDESEESVSSSGSEAQSEGYSQNDIGSDVFLEKAELNLFENTKQNKTTEYKETSDEVNIRSRTQAFQELEDPDRSVDDDFMSEKSPHLFFSKGLKSSDESSNGTVDEEIDDYSYLKPSATADIFPYETSLLESRVKYERPRLIDESRIFNSQDVFEKVELTDEQESIYLEEEEEKEVFNIVEVALHAIQDREEKPQSPLDKPVDTDSLRDSYSLAQDGEVRRNSVLENEMTTSSLGDTSLDTFISLLGAEELHNADAEAKLPGLCSSEDRISFQDSARDFDSDMQELELESKNDSDYFTPKSPRDESENDSLQEFEQDALDRKVETYTVEMNEVSSRSPSKCSIASFLSVHDDNYDNLKTDNAPISCDNRDDAFSTTQYESKDSDSDLLRSYSNLEEIPKFKSIKSEDADTVMKNLQNVEKRFNIKLRFLSQLEQGNQGLYRDGDQSSYLVGDAKRYDRNSRRISLLKANTLNLDQEILRPVLKPQLEEISSSPIYSSPEENSEAFTAPAPSIEEQILSSDKQNLNSQLFESFVSTSENDSESQNLNTADEVMGSSENDYEFGAHNPIKNRNRLDDEEQQHQHAQEQSEDFGGRLSIEEVSTDNEVMLLFYENTELLIVEKGLSLYPSLILEPEDHYSMQEPLLQRLEDYNNIQVLSDMTNVSNSVDILEPSSVVEPADAALEDFITDISNHVYAGRNEVLYPSDVVEVLDPIKLGSPSHNRIENNFSDESNEGSRKRKLPFDKTASHLNNIYKRIKLSIHSMLHGLTQHSNPSYSYKIPVPVLKSLDENYSDYDLEVTDRRDSSRSHSNSPGRIKQRPFKAPLLNSKCSEHDDVDKMDIDETETKTEERLKPQKRASSPKNKDIDNTKSSKGSGSASAKRHRRKRIFGLDVTETPLEPDKRLRNGTLYGSEKLKKTDDKAPGVSDKDSHLMKLSLSQGPSPDHKRKKILRNTDDLSASKNDISRSPLKQPISSEEESHIPQKDKTLFAFGLDPPASRTRSKSPLKGSMQQVLNDEFSQKDKVAKAKRQYEKKSAEQKNNLDSRGRKR